ncbi:unnamed protein product [Brachionus calyciflorus]|uniref:Uncharacterized protein n=1 Tax=Brachionus calyciflorus TaxID=104777 RepID=A0A813UD36_9BILA|nr:unnamed protein product [Brachionus calyciflorus]
MSSTGVLPFVRGIDFTRYNFDDVHKHPKLFSELQRLRWIRMNHTGITQLPDDMKHLAKLEQLHCVHNKLNSLNKDIVTLNCLRVLNLRDNEIRSENVPNDLNKLEDLTVLDLSFNDLTEVPQNLEEAKTILVLNLGHNRITSVPNYLFKNLTDLVFLDLSSNKLESIPPQLRRLVHLKTLILNDNPLLHAQLRQLPSLNSLETLHLKNTQRTLTNIPQGLDNLPNLKEVDLSSNGLSIIPDTIYKIKTLRRLDFSDNNLTEVSNMIGDLDELVTLNLSRNKLMSLPSAICKLARLKKLYVNSNYLNFVGIPAGIGKLGELEIFSVSDNRLEMLPEGLCRCGKLKKLFLNKNKLYTLPESIHFLQLQDLDVSDNPDFQMPSKPIEMQKVIGAGAMFYNIDFSLQNQLMLAGASPQQISATSLLPTNNPVKDPIARKKRLKLLKQNVNVNESHKVLKGMREVAESKKTEKKSLFKTDEIKGKRWDEQLEKPKLDYTEFFEEDAGHIPGIVCYEIDKFLPSPVETSLNGKFFEGDCYIILKTYYDESNNLNWQIFYWIGSQSTLDKQACAAMHAVNLRNLLGATCRTQREEQNEESDEFLDLFGNDLCYIEGARTSSGFYTVEDVEYVTRMYKVTGTQRIILEPVPIHYESLDPRHVFLLDYGMTIFLWNGAKCNPITRSKARLFAENINKYERKFQAELIQQKQGDEVLQFWKILEGPPEPEFFTKEFSESSNPPENDKFQPKLYKVGIGMGYLELPQVQANTGKLVLTKELLDTRGVYILDCFSDIFVWIGRKSTRLVRTAALKLSTSLEAMINRPSHTMVTSTLEGTENQIFKSKFEGWDDLIPVDYTRTADAVLKKSEKFKKVGREQRESSIDSVSSTSTISTNYLTAPNSSLLRSQSAAPTGSALPPILQNPSDALKTDLVALFKDRYVPLPDEEALGMMEEINDFLESKECFVYENKKFVHLPENEIGQFYSEDCYIYICKYWKIEDEEEEGKEDDENAEENVSESSIECKLYFWQGRDANNAGWLAFTFNLKNKFKNVEIIKLNQQQESPQFLAHFNRKFVIHKGKRKMVSQKKQEKLTYETKMYHLRRNPYSAICTRCIQLDTATASNLCSQFCYIVCVPFENTDQNAATKGIVYVWIGKNSNPDEAKIAEEIAQDIYDETYSIQVLNEGEEPETFFWHSLEGKKPYDTSAEYIKYMRLFRCSNDRGYFAVTEKCIDFCQDDLADDDVMILDNGENVYLWIGPSSSEIEVKLAFKSTQVYIQNLKLKQPKKQRKLLLTTKGKEPLAFTKCFHAWSKHKNLQIGNLEKKLILKQRNL